MELVFDGHNDVLLRLWHTMHKGGDPVAEFVNGTTAGHIDGPRAKKGGLAGGISAIYIPSGDFEIKAPDENGHYEMPLTAPLERAPSLDIALEFASIALKLGVSPQTVKVFRKQLYQRCGISSQAELFSLMLPLLG